MKKQTLYRVTVSILFCFFCRLPASAQSYQNLMTIQVPFDFQVNERQLPAGKYIIKRDSRTPQILLIQCPERDIRVVVQSILHSLSEQPRWTSLIFKAYGEKRFLSEVKVMGREDKFVLIKSKAERRLAQIEKEGAIHAIPSGATTNN